MGLSKKFTDIVFNTINKEGGKAYGSLDIRKIKGGIEYKVYYEMISKEKYSNVPAYIKLVFPDNTGIIITYLKELESAFKKSTKVSMTRYEFENRENNIRYLYLFQVGKLFFDLPEELALKLISMKLKLSIYEG